MDSVHSGGRRKGSADEGSVDAPDLMFPDCFQWQSLSPRRWPGLACRPTQACKSKTSPTQGCLSPWQPRWSDSFVPAWHLIEEETQNQRAETRLSSHSGAPGAKERRNENTGPEADTALVSIPASHLGTVPLLWASVGPSVKSGRWTDK